MDAGSKPRGTLGVAKKDVSGVADRAQAMHDGIVANSAVFSSLTITMAVFLGLITALVVAQQYATNTRAKGSAALRNVKLDALWTAMGILLAEIQGLADQASADAAIALLEAAGLKVATTPVHTKPVLAATLTTTPGVAHLAANATALLGKGGLSKKATFHWQRSDNGGKSWDDVGVTAYASTDATGLTLMSTYAFRVSVTIGNTPGAWSPAVMLLVL